jgi:hypothetical protein
MKTIMTYMKWAAMTLLLFISGFHLGSQYIDNNGNVFALDWSIPLICWLGAWIVHELSQLFSVNNELHILSEGNK